MSFLPRKPRSDIVAFQIQISANIDDLFILITSEEMEVDAESIFIVCQLKK